MVEVLRWAGNGLIFWSAIVYLASVALHLRVDWWRTQMGRHLMASWAVIAAVLALSSVRILFGDSIWFQLLRLVVFVGVPVLGTQRLYLQIKAQRCPPRRSP